MIAWGAYEKHWAWSPVGNNMSTPLTFEATTPIIQLEPKRGSYFVVVISSETIDQYPKKRSTRVVIELDDKVKYSCGLNHYGDGNFFIIIAKKHLQKLIWFWNAPTNLHFCPITVWNP